MSPGGLNSQPLTNPVLIITQYRTVVTNQLHPFVRLHADERCDKREELTLA